MRALMKLLAVALTITTTLQAYAESAVLEEIVVTAQKREQLANDVGIAVTTFSGNQLEVLGFEDSTDIIAYSPGVSLAGDIGGQRAIFNIRGVVQNDYADLAEAPVAVYVDGGYLASTQAQTFGLYDIERIEVLKGPQGTLFGRNATGGLVNTITAKPTEELDGYVEFTGARFNQLRLEGAVGGSLSETVRGRFSFLVNQQDEVLDNQYTGLDASGNPGTPGGGEDGQNDDTQAFRGQLEFDIGDRGSVLVIGNYADTTKSEGPYQSRALTQIQNEDGAVINVIQSDQDPMNCDVIQSGMCIDGNGDGSATRPVPGGSFFGDVEPDGRDTDVNKDFAFDDQNEISSQGLSVEVNYDFDNGIEFYSQTDYKSFERTVGLDSDQTARALLIFQSDGEIDQFSQEIRFSGSNDNLLWVAGVYYLDIDTDFLQGLAESAQGVDDFALLGAEANTITTLETQSLSAFGQVDINLNETLTLVAGLRFTQEDKDFTGTVGIFANNDDREVETDTLFATLLGPISDTNDQSLVSGKLQLEYTPNDDSLWYFGINRGVKAGSFNAALFAADFAPYDEEVLLSYEVGGKFTLAENRVQLNASVFFYDYDDFQSFAFLNNASQVTNEEATYVGAEVELFANPTPNLDVAVGVSFIDAEVEDSQIAPGIFVDTEPAFTPEWQASALVRYTFEEVFGGNLALQLNGSWKSEFFYTSFNFDAHELEASFIADARATWVDSEGHWSVAAFVDNLSDQRDSIIGFDVAGFYGTGQESFTKPRTFGVQVRRNF